MAIVMGLVFLAFGLIMIFRPQNVRDNFDRLANSWKRDTWHPYKLPIWALRMVGVVVTAFSAIFFEIAYAGLSR